MAVAAVARRNGNDIASHAHTHVLTLAVHIEAIRLSAVGHRTDTAIACTIWSISNTLSTDVDNV